MHKKAEWKLVNRHDVQLQKIKPYAEGTYLSSVRYNNFLTNDFNLTNLLYNNSSCWMACAWSDMVRSKRRDSEPATVKLLAHAAHIIPRYEQ